MNVVFDRYGKIVSCDAGAEFPVELDHNTLVITASFDEVYDGYNTRRAYVRASNGNADMLELVNNELRLEAKFVAAGTTSVTFELVNGDGDVKRMEKLDISINVSVDITGGKSKGQPYTVTVNVGSVVTGEPGTEAAVTNSGNEKDVVFDFVIPKGDTGEKGDKGEQGIQGEKGETGSSGVYIGEEEPTDPNVNVWFNPNGDESFPVWRQFYRGNGLFGETNKNVIEFPFVPKFVMVQVAEHPPKYLIAINGIQCTTTSDGDFLYIQWNDKTMSWYSTENSANQLNSEFVLYCCFAIG